MRVSAYWRTAFAETRICAAEVTLTVGKPCVKCFDVSFFQDSCHRGDPKEITRCGLRYGNVLPEQRRDRKRKQRCAGCRIHVSSLVAVLDQAGSL